MTRFTGSTWRPVVTAAALAVCCAWAIATTATSALAADPSAAPQAASSAAPSPAASAGDILGTGDPRTNGGGPGLVGSPFAVAIGVVLLGLVAAGGTVLYVRFVAGGPGDA